MNINKNLWILGLVSVGFSASLMEIGPVLNEKPVLDAKRKALGYSGRALTDQGSFFYDNPAALSFNEKTAFSASIETENSKLDAKGNKHSDGSFALPIFSLALPLFGDGGLGLGYVQTRSNDIQLNFDDQALYRQTGGTSEVVASASWSYLKTFSLGGSYRLITGSDKRTVYYPVPADEIEGTFDNANEYLLARNEEEVLSSGYNTAWSFHWQERLWSAYVGFQPAYTLSRKVSSNLLVAYDVDWAIGIRDRTELSFYEVEKDKKSIDQEIPAVWQMGMRYNFSPIQVFTLDGSFTDASSSEYRGKTWSSYQQSKLVNRIGYSIGMGYQLGASTKPFATNAEKSSIRLGADFLRASQSDFDQYRATLGFGIPLGSRGASIDISTEYGWRLNSQDWSEEFIGLSLSLTGLGNWGEPSRRYR